MVNQKKRWNLKKSEMIDKITELIEGEHSWDGPKCKISFEYAMGIALNVLEMQEEQGMLPPPKQGIVQTEENEEGHIVIPIWGWEDED